MGKVKNLINQKFGKLLVIATVQVAETGRNRWRCSCICDCGNETLVYTSNLTGGKTKSCGCSQNNKGENHGMYKHGYARLTDLGIDPAYKSWSKIKERCYNTNDPNYPLYGKLGITMEAEFITNFEAFLSEIGKLFSCKKLGIIPAFTRACEYRTDVIRRLNTEGADYSEKHGK